MLEHYLFAAYCLAGPACWFIYSLGAHTGLRRLDLLDQAPTFDTSAETVLAVVPAHNEEQTLHTCLASILAQHGCRLDVLAIDDRSADRTPEILASLQQRHPNLRVITLIDPPPPRQTGKCAAIIRGLAHIDDLSETHPYHQRPKWLLFVDADVTLGPGAIASALRLALKGKYGERNAGHDLVSLLPRQTCHTVPERTAVPLFAAAIVALWAVPYANVDRLRTHAFACGQFFLIRSDLYTELGGHTKVAAEYAEDVELARLAKKYGAQPRVANAPGYATVSQRAGVPSLVHQWSRNVYGMKFLRPLPLLTGLAFPFLTVLPGPVAAAWTLHRWITPPFHPAECAAWTAAVFLHATFLAYGLRATYAAQALPTSTLMWLPYGLWLYLRVFFRALRLTINKNVAWRPPVSSKNRG